MCFEYLKLLAKELLWRQLIKYIMRRASKVRQFQLGYSDDQLENIIIRLNNEAMGELQAGNLKKVQQILTQANLMLERFDKPDKISATKQRLKAFTLNGWACYQHQKKQSADALKLIDEAIKLQQGAMQDNLSLARSYLNKCVILSQMENHEEALKLAHLAITCLENEKKGVGASRKRRQKLSQLFVISFYNIAAEFEFLDNDESATDAYKKGYEICRELLGERHRLSLLMRKNLKIMKSRRDSRIPTLSDMDVSSRKRRIKTIEIQLYRDRRNSSKKYSKDNRSTLLHLERGKSRENPISESRLLSKPENYLHLKNIKERISRLGNQNNQEEDETKIVTRLRKIYMPDSYRKHKVKSRKTSKTQNSTNSGKHNHTQQIESINNHWSRRQDKFMVHSQVYHTAPSIKQSYLTQKILPPVTQPPPSQLPQKSIQLPNINRPNLTEQKSRECKLI